MRATLLKICAVFFFQSDILLKMIITWTSIFSSLVLIIFLWIYYINQSKLRKLMKKLPGPPTLPILGNVLDVCSDHAEHLPLFLSYASKWPGLFRYWLGPIPYVFLYRKETVEPILSSTIHISKPPDTSVFHDWIGLGLVTSNGEKWRMRRKLLTPAFHFSILKDFVPIFNEQSGILVQHLSKHLGKEMDIVPFITNCTLDIICETAMGRNMNAQSDTTSEFVTSTDKMKTIIITRYFQPWWRWNLLFNLTPMGREHARCVNILHRFTDTVIKEKKTELQNKTSRLTSDDDTKTFGQKKRLALLDLLLETSDNGRVLSDNDIREEVDTFMFAGHDTTAAAISWTIYLLGAHPEIQRKVQDELDAIFGLDCTRPVTTEDLADMNLLERVIKESMRLYPPVPLLVRQLNDDIIIGDYTLPGGATAMMSPYLLHRDPEVFSDPEVFNPDRFLPENTRGRHPFAYAPFSAGPRNCIGQKFALLEEKVVLSHIFRFFNVVSMESQKDIRVVSDIILKSATGIKVYLTSRK